MKTTLKQVTKAVAIGALAFGAMAGQAMAKTDLNLVFLANTQDEEYDAALVFKNYVENQTGGSVQVNIFPGAQLCGSAVECFEAMKAGVVDVYTATAGGAAVIYPPAQAMDIPYTFTNDRVAEMTLRDPEFNKVVRDNILEATNNQILMLSMSNTGGWRNFANTKRPIKTPADVKGLKLRTIESEIQQNLVRDMGGSPTPLPFMEVYTALQTGVIDGTKNSISDITNMKFQERLKHLTLDGHGYMANMWFTGNAKFQSLTEAEKRAVVDGAAIMSSVQFGIQPRKELQAFEDWKKSGGKIYAPTPEEKAEFRKSAAPIRDWYLGKYGDEGKDFLAELEGAVKRSEDALAAQHGTFFK